MGNPFPVLPRRRPLPPLGSYGDFRRHATYPHAVRMLLTVGAIFAVLCVVLCVYAYINRDNINTAVTATIGILTFLVAAGTPRIFVPLAFRQLYRRTVHGGMLCDVYPVPAESTKGPAILIDTRMPDQQAAQLHDALVSWASRAEGPTAPQRLSEVFANGQIVAGEQLLGPHARGSFLLNRTQSSTPGCWFMLVPTGRDVEQQYQGATAVEINIPPMAASAS